MLETILILVTIAIIALVLVASMQPDDFRVTRNNTIAAPAAAVFAHVNDLTQWDAWSPWAKLDPNAKNSFEGATTGVGATMRWSGNSKVGVGSMTITDNRPSEFIQFNLEFLKPFAANNTAEFTFTPEGDQTRVTWSMYGKNKLMAKVMGLIINCDKMVGGQFEQGLENLKSVVERLK